MTRLTSRDYLMAAALAACVGAAGLAYEWYQNRPRFALEQSQLILEALPTGQEQEAVYRIHNLTGNVLRIVGAESG